MADNRTMTQMLQAPIEGYEDAIVVPPINANNFKLKQTLINLIQSNQFIGRQDPHNHLCFFNKFTSTFRHPEYPDVHPPSQEISDEVFQAKGDLMKSIQTFLEEFNYIPFGEKPKILLQAWDKFFAIQHAQPEDSNELFQKLLEDLQIIKELKCNRPTFFEDNEDHSVQPKEYSENSSNEIASSNSNQEKEKPPQV
uniref:Reverse transcriptase domain-containing protein n=1 Tax=Tanacetum cinerariifolium TaxID=118510 RepID=A0A6L2LZU2_TANCI|nr:reverse transcriptase domain-containing protein [Tanacetum cinerariifolium]